MQLKDNLVVLDIAGNRAVLETADENKKNELSSIGFVCDGNRLTRPIVDDSERQRLVEKLINMDALFSEGRDWSPAELLDYYCEQGRIKGAYKVIYWKSQDNYFVTEKNCI
jgi:hypothetical protein